uniref:Translation initiation factor eIF2 assembly protein n=1 Tax=Nothobranchius furzeri TaxID=105023 RepID=A0A8C6PKI5_NOTFU
MKKEQVANCQFSVWYPIFKKHTIKSQILPLPQNVIDYLLDDGTLVVSGRYESTRINSVFLETCATQTCYFLCRFLQCSDQDSPDPVISYELVLRKWSELIPGGEFRCFVKENKLIAISQRDYTQYYQHILTQEQNISHAIQDFFSQHIQYHFLDEDCELQIYSPSGRVWLIDLNPFGEVTDSLLFRWDELTSGGEDGPAFRYTMSEVTVQPSPCLSYRIPRDFVDLSTGEDAYKLIDFLKLNQQSGY